MGSETAAIPRAVKLLLRGGSVSPPGALPTTGKVLSLFVMRVGSAGLCHSGLAGEDFPICVTGSKDMWGIEPAHLYSQAGVLLDSLLYLECHAACHATQQYFSPNLVTIA